MKYDFLSFIGKTVKIIDVDNKRFVGQAVTYDDPENSEDGNWWLDVDVPKFGMLTISEPEIKSIEIVN